MKFVCVCTLLLFSVFNSGCSSKLPVQAKRVISPLGLYKSNTKQKFWLAIMTNNQYLLCSPSSCSSGNYEQVPANYGVILNDFFKTEIGLKVETLSHGLGNSKSFYKAMKELRLSSDRADDLAFNIGDCDGTPCAGVGHMRHGVKFYKIENFDQFWRITNRGN